LLPPPSTGVPPLFVLVPDAVVEDWVPCPLVTPFETLVEVGIPVEVVAAFVTTLDDPVVTGPVVVQLNDPLQIPHWI